MSGCAPAHGSASLVRRLLKLGLLTLVLASCGGGDGGNDGGTSVNPPSTGGNPPQNPPPPTPAPVPAFQTPYPYVDVLHNMMEFDPTRGLLYAYVAPGDRTHPKSFAIIDVATQAVQYTGPFDFVPWQMRVSQDGKYLYVATANTREVVRLTLPGFAVDIRFGLGVDPTTINGTNGQPFDAGDIVVSPQDSRRIVVSLFHLDYHVCAMGLRMYSDATTVAELFQNDVNGPGLGDGLTIDPAGRLVTVCTGGTPDIVTRVSQDNDTLTILDTGRGVSGQSNSIQATDIAILSGTGGKWDMPQFTLRGYLPPLTLDPFDDTAPPLYGCVFADDVGAVAACISQVSTDSPVSLPTFRTFVLYELTNANSFGYVPLDLAANNHVSKIIRLGTGQFAVSVGPSTDSVFFLSAFQYLQQNTRIYFLSGISTTYPP